MQLHEFLDLLGNELRNARLQHLAADPADVGTGFAYYNVTIKRARVLTDDGWITWGDPTIAPGSISDEHIAADAAIAITKLAVNPLDYADNAVATAIAALIDTAPATLDTLRELAEALQAEESATDAILTELGLRTRRYEELIGDGVATEILVTHGLGKQWVTPTFYDVATGDVILAGWRPVDANSGNARFSPNPPAADGVRIVLVG